ncbi:LLM class flavin-dependent oxidoreductase (plasmid) [Sphingomonas daechungensis]|uniref:LLM class flavin-dependent oxidoreductase n=1 Tax=Sphingomonas daechungensis TaxID=1176646 RepID=A0ABX6T3W7_9SPHN|nr:LLM class flavin-dependent oxidoreductase [Sphingomonas daechungensis]QNP44587.1 LLM class flavin-dependent oxidoreductase [Sphingomonas daechungensis]
MIPLSVLDLAPIVEGATAGQAFRNSAGLAQLAERLGYRRFWMAEHHSMPGIASAATAVVLAYVGSQTSNIRIGAGGIMLPNHAPLTVAEQFGTLESLYPGRIDLGLGRAPGTDQAAAHALRRNLASDENQFPRDVVELQEYFRGESGGVRAVPGEGLNIPLWILGSSLFGAQLAAMLGLPYAFASHFAPQMMMEAVSVYRERFKPSEQLAKPYVMLGFNAIVADTDEEAKRLATSVQQAFVALRTGRPIQLPPPKAGYLEELPLEGRALLRSILSVSAIGSRETARHQLQQFVDRTKPDELMVTSQVFDHEARLKSYELLMTAVQQTSETPTTG